MKTDTYEADDFLSLPEASGVARISLRQVYRYLNSGDLTGVKMGRRTLIPRAELKRFLAQLPPYLINERKAA